MSYAEFMKTGDRVVFLADQAVHNLMGRPMIIEKGASGTVTRLVYESSNVARTGWPSVEPGVYRYVSGVQVTFDEGTTVNACGNVFLVDGEEMQQRIEAARAADSTIISRMERTGDLPETRFWEGDLVRVVRDDWPYARRMKVVRIDYGRIHARRNDGSSWPFYALSCQTGVEHDAEDSWLELARRGRVWRYYHGQPVAFRSLQDEAAFFASLGHVTEIRNPDTKVYAWSRQEFLAGLYEGLVHGFTPGSGFYGERVLSISAIRYRDEELGARVAAELLRHFESATA